MNNLKNIQEHVVKLSTNGRRPILSNLFAGLGIYHAVYNEDSASQAVLAFIAPSVYVGYNSFKNYDKIKEEVSGWFGKGIGG